MAFITDHMASKPSLLFSPLRGLDKAFEGLGFKLENKLLAVCSGYKLTMAKLIRVCIRYRQVIVYIV